MSLHERLQKKERWPLLMGILNVTPDSFSDGGSYQLEDAIKQQIGKLASEGADIIDIGGESTRPGAQPVSLDEELVRVVPVIELVRRYSDCAISVDTYKTGVMREALRLGVEMINDVNALQDNGAVQVVAQSNALVCLMHKQGDPQTMQSQPHYDDILTTVSTFVCERAAVCEAAGILAQHIVLDPGFGFGKTFEHNQCLMQNLSKFVDLGYPLLVGVSRKTMIGQVLNNAPVSERVIGSVAAAMLAAQRGAAIVRVHDVLATRDALAVLNAFSADDGR
ncbi:MAG: dihydropteroate synthase [Thiomicrospira sp.]|jgi:dihydropteroate synthase|nr:dihydropteroate synthase [Thiomicrospira sp.]